MKCGRGMLDLVDADLLDLALAAADLLDHAAHAVAQALDGTRREADVHQFVGNLLLQLEVGLVLRTLAWPARYASW
jgi:hypothetical protein